MSARMSSAPLIASAAYAIVTPGASAEEDNGDPIAGAVAGNYGGTTGRGPSIVAIAGTPGSGGGSSFSGGGTTGGAEAAPAGGGGSGAGVLVSASAVGSDADVAAVAAAVNAGSAPAPANPNVVTDIVQGPQPGDVVQRAWFRNIGGVPHLQYRFTCSGPGAGPAYDDWVAVLAQGGTFVPQPQPEDLLPELYERGRAAAPHAGAAHRPGRLDAGAVDHVHLPTFFWVDQSQGQWASVEASASVPGLTVTARAVPERLVVHPGDGTGDITCEGAPLPFVQGRDDLVLFAGCEHAYRDSSAMAASGDAYPVTVDVIWHATWSASNGESGDLGTVSTTSETRPLPVAEIQALVTDGSTAHPTPTVMVREMVANQPIRGP